MSSSYIIAITIVCCCYCYSWRVHSFVYPVSVNSLCDSRKRWRHHHAPYTNLQQLTNNILLINNSPASSSSSSNRYCNNDKDLEDHDDTDWLQAELTLQKFPSQPSPDIEPLDVLRFIIRSLQFVDHPTPSSGLERIFQYIKWECRKIITARKGGDTIERFMKYGLLAPALQPFMGATRIQIGEGTTIAGSQTRGDILSFPITIHGSQVSSFQHSSGMIKDTISSKPPVTNMIVRLEKNRRPPLQHCWLVREVVDVKYVMPYKNDHDDATSH